jgi:hypothetical protein
MKALLNPFLFILTCSLLLLFSCSNPIEKKQKELSNCKVTVRDIEIKKILIVPIPPVPKIFFKVSLEVYNTNDVPVTIEKFHFKIATFQKEDKPIYIAEATNGEEYKFEPLEVKEIPLEMETIFEENLDSRILVFLLEMAKGALRGGEIELLFEGTVEFNTLFGKISVPVKEKMKTKVKLKK